MERYNKIAIVKTFLLEERELKRKVISSRGWLAVEERSNLNNDVDPMLRVEERIEGTIRDKIRVKLPGSYSLSRRLISRVLYRLFLSSLLTSATSVTISFTSFSRVSLVEFPASFDSLCDSFPKSFFTGICC